MVKSRAEQSRAVLATALHNCRAEDKPRLHVKARTLSQCLFVCHSTSPCPQTSFFKAVIQSCPCFVCRHAHERRQRSKAESLNGQSS